MASTSRRRKERKLNWQQKILWRFQLKMVRVNFRIHITHSFQTIHITYSQIWVKVSTLNFHVFKLLLYYLFFFFQRLSCISLLPDPILGCFIIFHVFSLTHSPLSLVSIIKKKCLLFINLFKVYLSSTLAYS